MKFLNIRSAAHVVKGAAANLFCEGLRSAAYDLEMAAKEENLDFKDKFEKLEEAALNYERALQEILKEGV